ncbi:MAG: sigma-70 family RNA polymerase sigma factor [Ignavibacteriales bacterium]|nr:sigma-70 family RNA polymerase sigma factor [Ignavibacteriales bacterium]
MKSEENQIIEFTLLFNKHKRRVYSYALKMLGDKMHADDVVQDVFIKLFEHLNSIQNRQSVQFWLFKTARNEILTFYRSTKTKS